MFEITQVVLVLVLNLRGKKAFSSVLLIILIMSFLLGHWKIFHGKIRVSSFIVTFACFAFAIEGLVPKKYFVRYSTPWRYQRPLEEIRETIVHYSCRYCLIFSLKFIAMEQLQRRIFPLLPGSHRCIRKF